MRNHNARVHGNNPGRGPIGSAMWDAQTARKESPRSIASECGPVVYAFRLKDGTVKIGHTTNLVERAHKLGCGLTDLLALKPGTLEDEQAIHAGLKDHRHHGREYYYPTPAVIAVVNDMRATFGLAPVAA